MSEPVRFVFRSRPVQLPMLLAMRASGAWTRAGLDPGPGLPYVSNAREGDSMLERGEIDLVLGSHVTPYLRYDDGVPFVYLGQTVNWKDDVLVTRDPVSALEEIRGWRIADRVGVNSHARGNHILYLRRVGIAKQDCEWVDLAGGDDGVTALVEERADAFFLSPYRAPDALAAGLNVLQLPRLAMVNAATVTTLWPYVEANPELYRRVLRALRFGIAYFVDETEPMRELMRTEVSEALGIDDPAVADALYERNRTLLDRSLYPHHEAVANAYDLAVHRRPDLPSRVSPHALWDVHFLRELDAEGAGG